MIDSSLIASKRSLLGDDDLSVDSRLELDVGDLLDNLLWGV